MRLNRRRAAGGAAIVTVIAALVAASASTAASPPAPAPVDDDYNYLQLGALAERVSVELYTTTLRSKLWDKPQRAQLRALLEADGRQGHQLRLALGAEAPAAGDFEITLPPASLRTKAKVLALARSLERLAVSVYTAGAQGGQDPGTRLLLAKLLGQDVQHLSTLAVLRGNSPVTPLPGAIGPERAALAIDRFLTVPEAPEIPAEQPTTGDR